MKKSAEYILSAYSLILSNSLENISKVGYPSKDGIPIPSFDENILISLCKESQRIFQNESNILKIEGDFVIVGDIHGSLHDIIRIINYVEKNDIKALFLGDYVNRGSFSLECITLLFALKVMNPKKYFLLRGNHEFDSMCSQYGFKDEILNYHNPKKENDPPEQQQQTQQKIGSDFLSTYFKKKEMEKTNNNEFNEINDYNYTDVNCYRYSERLYNEFISSFAYLPIGAVINDTTFCVHGGLSPLLDQVDNLVSLVKRPINNFDECTILSDVLWSDPSFIITYPFDMNPRGRGYLYGRKAIINFLNQNILKRLVRGHQCVINGTISNFNDKLITIFSSSSYDGNLNNSSGIMKLFQKDDKFELESFPPINRLKKSDAFYYKVQQFGIDSEKAHTCFSFHHSLLPNLESPKKNINQIRPHQSTFYLPSKFVSKPSFITNSKKSMSTVQNTFCASSLSMNNINDQKMSRITKTSSAKSLFSVEYGINSLKK